MEKAHQTSKVNNSSNKAGQQGKIIQRRISSEKDKVGSRFGPLEVEEVETIVINNMEGKALGAKIWDTNTTIISKAKVINLGEDSLGGNNISNFNIGKDSSHKSNVGPKNYLKLTPQI